MKKVLTMLLLMVAAATAWAAVGDYYSNSTLKYKIITEATSNTPGTVSCVGLSDAAKAKSVVNVIIPWTETINGLSYNIIEVGGNAFSGATNVSTLIIRYGVPAIKSGAFKGCTSLTTVTLPSSINTIAINSFYGCNKLTTVYFARQNVDGLYVGSNAFNASVPYLYMARGTKLSDSAFTSGLGKYFTNRYTASAACDFTLANGAQFVVTDDSGSSYKCAIVGFSTSAQSTTDAQNGRFAPQNYFSISGYSKSFHFTDIAEDAFNGNSQLKEADLSNLYGLDSLRYKAFDYATQLVKVTTTAPKIKPYAFTNCPNLSVVSLAYGVKDVGILAFNDCAKLRTIEIPSTATSVNKDFFLDCPSLTRIAVSTGNSNYHNYMDGSAIYSTEDNALMKVAAGASAVTIDPACTRLLTNSIYHCNALTEVNIPYGVQVIEKMAIAECPKIQTIVIPSSAKLYGSSIYIIENLQNLYYNHNTPTVIASSSSFWQQVNNHNLYVPYGAVDNYKSRTNFWGKFDNYNKDGRMAYDYHESAGGKGEFYYTVTSTEPCTVNGKRYDGRAKLVNAIVGVTGHDSCNLPAHITINKKNYAVTCIGEEAVELISGGVYFNGCENVDSVLYRAFDSEKTLLGLQLPYASYIGEEACDDCTGLTSLYLGSRLRRIEKWGFCNAPLSYEIYVDGNPSDIAGKGLSTTDAKLQLQLPYGFEYLGYRAFQGSKISALLVPSSAVINSEGLYKMGNLQNLVVNNPRAFGSAFEPNLTDVPSSCNLYVPAGYKDIAKGHSSWKKFAAVTYDGSYDFETNKLQFYTVTSTNPYHGVKEYDGTVKMVCNPAMAGYTINEVNQSCGNLGKQYAITCLEKNCFTYMTGMTSCVFWYSASNLKEIQSNAFTGTQVAKLKIPASVTTLGVGAFEGAIKLNDLVLLHEELPSSLFDNKFYGNNDPEFTCYVHYTQLPSLVKRMSKFTAGHPEIYSAWVNNPSVTNGTYAISNTIDYQASGVKAYIATRLDYTNQVVNTRQVTAVASGTGVFVTGIPTKTEFLFRRAASGKTLDAVDGNLFMGVGASAFDPQSIPNAITWNDIDEHFNTFGHVLAPGSVYLLPTTTQGDKPWYIDLLYTPPTPVYERGDVNGDGVVDVTDANILTNIILGKDNADNYGGRADVDGSGVVDVSDANAATNIILGK